MPDNPQTLQDALSIYTQNSATSEKTRKNLITTLKLYVLPYFGYTESERKNNFEQCSASMQLKDFLLNSREHFEQAYVAAVASGKNEDTLRNNKSDITRFLNWGQLQPWYQTTVNIIGIPEKAPVRKIGISLKTHRRGRNSSSKDPYSLKETELSASLKTQIASLHQYLTDKTQRASEQAIREITWKTNLSEILKFLGWLRKEYEYGLDDLNIIDMADASILKEYIAWRKNARGNNKGTIKLALYTALNVAKWAYQAPDSLRKETTEKIKELKLQYCSGKKEPRTTSKEAFGEKLLLFEQCEEIVRYLRDCCASKNSHGLPRTPDAIINSWQNYMIAAILTYTPIRQKEIRELELGNNLTKQDDVWWVIQSPEHTKNGKPREFPLFPCDSQEQLTRDLDEYVDIWRKKAELSHNFLFFMRRNFCRKEAPIVAKQPTSEHQPDTTLCSTVIYANKGKPIPDENHLSRLLPRMFFKASAILYGKDNAKRPSPHDFRRGLSTWVFKNGELQDRTIYAEIMGHSEEQLIHTYQQVESREFTEKAAESFQRISKNAKASRDKKNGPNIVIANPKERELKQNVAANEQRLANLSQDNSQLRQDNLQLRQDNSQLRQQVTALTSQMLKLNQENADLKNQLKS